MFKIQTHFYTTVFLHRANTSKDVQEIGHCTTVESDMAKENRINPNDEIWHDEQDLFALDNLYH